MNRNFKTSKDKRANYIYYGIDGSKTILIPGEDGVNEALIETLHNFDDDEFDSSRRMRRKYGSLEAYNDKSAQVEDLSVDVEDDVFSAIKSEQTSSLVHKAILQLKPQQRDLIYAIYLSKNPMTQAEYAKVLGVAESSVQQNARRARAKLKDIIGKINF